jgi:hypothetical protein
LGCSEEHRRALDAAIETARRRGRLREFETLDALRQAIEPLFAATAPPAILEAWVHSTGMFYGVALIPPGPTLHEGDWHAGPVTINGREGLVVALVVPADILDVLKAWAKARQVLN